MTAYGGYGFTSRMWGLTLDNIASIDVVLANGTLVTTSHQNHPDLFWVTSTIPLYQNLFLSFIYSDSGNARRRRFIRHNHLHRIHNPPSPFLRSRIHLRMDLKHNICNTSPPQLPILPPLSQRSRSNHHHCGNPTRTRPNALLPPQQSTQRLSPLRPHRRLVR